MITRTFPMVGSRRSLRVLERNVMIYRAQWVMLVSGFFEPLFYLLSISIGLNKLAGPLHVDGRVISYSLFVAPGMAHCSGGEGPNDFDKIATLEQWVELGKAPDQIVASHSTAGKVDRTRPLCPYPQVAHYKGTGSIDEASNFTCVRK